MSGGTAGRILDSANPRDKKLKEGGVRCSADEREHSKHDEGAQVPRWKLREPVCQKILMRQYASSPRKEKSENEREEERDYKGIAQGASSAPRLASSSAASFPRDPL